MSDLDGTPGSMRCAASAFEEACAVADAVLYEGYLLYPYRRSSPKNRVRWQFGILAPRAWAEANGPVTPGVSGSVESWQQQTECLLRAEPDAVVHVRVRYLQMQHRGVERRDEDGRHTPVESLEASGAVHLAFDEAVPRETDFVIRLGELLAGDRDFACGAPGGEETEVLPGGVGRLVRRRRPVEARTTLHVERVAGSGSLHRLRVRTENTGQWPPDNGRWALDDGQWARDNGRWPPESGRWALNNGQWAPESGRWALNNGQWAPESGQWPTSGTERDQALRHALIAAHTFIGGDGLSFFSSADPPDEVAAQVKACRNLHTFPVLGGEEGSDRLVLSSPIILPDHPQVAPESPGDLHDAAEIDEILTLRTLVLTDDEKREARATDPRAAQILDRVETMPPEVLSRLHGAIRSLAPSAGPDEQAATVPDQEGRHGRHRVAEA